MAKERIDIVLTKRGMATSRERAKILVMAGEVFVNNQRVLRPDIKVPHDIEIKIKEDPIPYVSYGGVKLERALRECNIDVSGKKAIDIGSSTGGFTDCLLQHGASHVYAIDVGSNQLHERLCQDKRVSVKEGINARYLSFDDIGERVDIITIDVSFISLKKILPAAIPLLNKGGIIISLVKPQFEVGRYRVGKGGIVRDEDRIAEVIKDIKEYGTGLGITPTGTVEAPRDRQRKNREFFIVWVL
ncbi:MAG TPA: TlyA family RNA methyltransferase [Syntrophorhabdaceae bacterium]|nr:TlyA family RNA methyltransferase [Syntrophorhabdaceae bacterium]HOL05365.1 TlyA family RNA methyltransferase [Syntrophorhabdaceae bacterium]HON85036.1 TlyA family RNA methyltransferase [Syntrophorhabdaceae bacterium]HOT41545.1 TlyA family RNA methyltransferase [Syntrophorhabdaceae bacterium]HPC65843.1 TlyA family RNA methyltransferase [Syntrophorhabdaceae bacterium]